MADDRHANHDDIDTSSRPPQNDPQRHTHMQHSCDPVRSGLVKGSGPAHRDQFRCILKSRRGDPTPCVPQPSRRRFNL